MGYSACLDLLVATRIASWHSFKPKKTIWVNFGGSCNGRCWYYIYVHLVYFMAIWYILWPFGIFYGYLVFFPVLVCCTKINQATLVATGRNNLFWRQFGRKCWRNFGENVGENVGEIYATVKFKTFVFVAILPTHRQQA
jgi:hypothetical protein